MARLLFISHPEVVVDPAVPIPDWGLSETGRRRADAFARSEVMAEVTRLVASAERKARETAEILAAPRDLPVEIVTGLGENDRSATGFLPPSEFEATADAFFARPERSVRGWERAVDAEARVLAAVRAVLADHDGGDLAIVSHGAVGTLLYCHLAGLAIDRRHDQPGQGHYWAADLPGLVPAHGWRPIAAG